MRRVLVVISALALGSGCSPGAEEPALDGRMNVIVLMVDTLRADHMSLFDYHRPTTPHLEALAADALVFEHARSQASCTFPSVNAFMTSRWPSVFLFQPDRSFAIPSSIPTLAEVLRERGWSTAAVSASPIVRATPSAENPYGGFGAGFDHFVELDRLAPASAVNSRGLALVRKLPRPFFAYLHYMDPHDPYTPPESHAERFVRDGTDLDWVAEGNPNPIADMLYDDGPEVSFAQRDMDHLVDLYDAEIAAFDEEVERLVESLRGLGLLDRTIIVLTGDHGEEFMEHGHIKHCHVLFEASTRVPLIVRVPGSGAGRRIDLPVQSVDVVPTMLDLLDIPRKHLQLSGVSLLPVISGSGGGARTVFSDQGKWRSADDGRFKLLLDAKEGRPQLFDLRDDPGEQRDLWQDGEPGAEALAAELHLWLNRTQKGVSRTEAIDIAAEREEQLRALGYLQ